MKTLYNFATFYICTFSFSGDSAPGDKSSTDSKVGLPTLMLSLFLLIINLRSYQFQLFMGHGCASMLL